MGHKVETKEKNTQALTEEYKGSAVFAIWEMTEEGDKIGPAPVISFGKAKAKEILKHYDKLRYFVNGEEDL